MFSSTQNIFKAAAAGDLALVKQSAKSPAELSQSDKEGYTPLHWASLGGHTPVVQYLLTKGIAVDARTKYQERTPLFLAAQEGHLETATLLLQCGANVEATNKKYDGATALHRAALEGHGRMVMLLLDAGANVNARDIEGLRPLHWAILRDHAASARELKEKQVATARLLIEKGAKLEPRTDKVSLYQPRN